MRKYSVTRKTEVAVPVTENFEVFANTPEDAVKKLENADDMYEYMDTADYGNETIIDSKAFVVQGEVE